LTITFIEPPYRRTADVPDRPSAYLYYVMPYVEGESLRDKLNREKQLGIEQSIEITKAVASALDYAHRHKVIHRDIKPENILLHDGQPVVADFGIALAVKAAGGTRLTETGLSLGTPQYMSPEQATADREIDGRSDIYSLACVLYEMLCGEPPFTGPTVQAVIAKVVTDLPRPISELRDTTPSHVAASLHKALAKLPADRFENPHQFAEAVSGARPVDLATPGVSGVGVAVGGDGATTGGAQRWGWVLPWLIAAVMAAVAIVATVSGGQPEEGNEEPIRLVVPVPLDYRVDPGRLDAAALAPDGGSVVYRARKQDTVRLVHYSLISYEPTLLVGTEDGRYPFFSPDGEWVGFVVDNQVRKIRLADGLILDIAEWQQGTTIATAVWPDNDSIVFSAGGRLWIVSAEGGTPAELIKPDSTMGEISHVGFLRAFPGGRVAFYIGTEADLHPAVLSLGDRSWNSLSVRPRAYTTSGYLVFGDGVDLRIGPFDPATLEPKGTSVPVPVSGEFTLVNVSPGGTALYQDYPSFAEQQVVWFDRDGSITPLLEQIGNYRWSRLSPDGTQLATGLDGDDIWIFDVHSMRQTRLRHEGNNDEPVWTSDGSRVAYSAPKVDSADVYWRAADGTGEPELLVSLDTLNAWPTSFSPDDRYFAFYSSPRGTANQGEMDIWLLDLQSQSSRAIIATPAHEFNPMFSPDGRWIAYQSDESGQWEIYVRPFPELNYKHTVSVGGGTNPIWSKDGRELFYLSRQTMVSVEIAPGETFQAGQPRALFRGDFIVDDIGDQCFDVAPDGRFVMRMFGPNAASEIRLVVNWMTEVERLLEDQR